MANRQQYCPTRALTNCNEVFYKIYVWRFMTAVRVIAGLLHYVKIGSTLIIDNLKQAIWKWGFVMKIIKAFDF